MPTNRIVVDYGGERKLVLIAKIHTQSGEECSAEQLKSYTDYGYEVAQSYEGVTDVDSLRNLAAPNSEGFVIRYKSGVRVKVKTAEYMRLHRILTGITEKNLLEDYLMTGADLQPLLDRVPDEFYDWVKATVADFQGQYDTIERDAKAMLAEYAGQDRRTCGIAFSKMAFAHVLFKMLDGKPYEKMIWKLIRPKTLTTFKRGEG